MSTRTSIIPWKICAETLQFFRIFTFSGSQLLLECSTSIKLSSEGYFKAIWACKRHLNKKEETSYAMLEVQSFELPEPGNLWHSGILARNSISQKK